MKIKLVHRINIRKIASKVSWFHRTFESLDFESIYVDTNLHSNSTNDEKSFILGYRQTRRNIKIIKIYDIILIILENGRHYQKFSIYSNIQTNDKQTGLQHLIV